MRTLSVVGALGLSFMATATVLVATSAATGCTDGDILPYDAGRDAAADANDASDGATDAGDAGPTPETGDATKGRALFLVDGTYAVVTYGGSADASVDAPVTEADPNTEAVSPADGNSFLRAGDGFTYVVDQSTSKVHVLDTKDPARQRTDAISLADKGGVVARDVKPTVFQTTASRVLLAAANDSNLLKVVDGESLKQRTTLDLSDHLAVDDADGTVDVVGSVFDPSSSLAYLLLQNVNRADVGGAEPDRLGACVTSTGTLVGVNPTTAEEAVISKEADPHAITLLGHHPMKMVLDAAGSRLLVLHRGCWGVEAPDAGAAAGTAHSPAADAPPVKLARIGRGIEAVDLKAHTSTWLYQPKSTNTDELTDLLWVDASHVFVRAGGAWRGWDSAQPVLNSIVDAFPAAPAVTSDSHVVGVSEGEVAGTVDMISFDVKTKSTEVLKRNVFAGKPVDLTKRASSVLLPKP